MQKIITFSCNINFSSNNSALDKLRQKRLFEDGLETKIRKELADLRYQQDEELKVCSINSLLYNNVKTFFQLFVHSFIHSFIHSY